MAENVVCAEIYLITMSTKSFNHKEANVFRTISASVCSTWQNPSKDSQHLIFIQFTFAAFICASIASASFTLPMER
jgi:hypothetical protein